MAPGRTKHPAGMASTKFLRPLVYTRASSLPSPGTKYVNIVVVHIPSYCRLRVDPPVSSLSPNSVYIYSVDITDDDEV